MRNFKKSHLIAQRKKNKVIKKNIKFAMSLYYIQKKFNTTFFILNINIKINKHFN